jgi:hypothetical protein
VSSTSFFSFMLQYKLTWILTKHLRHPRRTSTDCNSTQKIYPLRELISRTLHLFLKRKATSAVHHASAVSQTQSICPSQNHHRYFCDRISTSTGPAIPTGQSVLLHYIGPALLWFRDTSMPMPLPRRTVCRMAWELALLWAGVGVALLLLSLFGEFFHSLLDNVHISNLVVFLCV